MNDLVSKLDSVGIGSEKGRSKMSKTALMRSSLKKIANFVEPALTFLNCHFTDYYLKSYWDTLLPEKLRLDLESKSIDEVKQCMTDLTTGNWRMYPTSHLNFDGNFSTLSTLKDLIVTVGRLKLHELNLCTSYKNLEENRQILKNKFPEHFVDLEFDKFMSSKKMHEVLKFSEFIACTCNEINLGTSYDEIALKEIPQKRKVNNIVDVGSGKGYLSSFLAMYYDHKVLAIDASASNTEGCDKRTAKLDKTWPQLVRRAKERQKTGTCTNMGKHWKKKLAKLGISEEDYLNSLKLDTQPGENNLKSVTEMITTKTNLQNLVDTNLSENEEGENNEYGIVGLHTCGNLGANILKLFLHNENAKFICVVPCCYNLVQEDEALYPKDVFYGSKFALKDGGTVKSAPWPDGSIGFPLSSVLKNYNDGKIFVIGRNARMLSAYSLPRMIQEEVGLEMPPVLYYRAMLQVVLKQNGLLSEGEDNNDIRVGRMTKKCSNFNQYVEFALRKLGIDLRAVRNETIDKVEAEYGSSEMLDKFHKYYLLRAMYAAVVEDLILLDRIVYLLEQDSIEEAALVQLFDPALSPRSHAILAFKSKFKES